MKKILLYNILLCTLFVNAQVGIGTSDPQADLHVAGDLLIQDNTRFGQLATVNSQDEDFKLLTKIENSTPPGEIKVLDVNELSVAPVNVIEYEFTNISLDNLSDVDLQYDSDRYIVGVANFRYIGDPIKKVAAAPTKSIGNFVVNTFINNGTWHLEIRNRTLDLNVGDSVEYYITLIVYDKSYYRYLTPINTNLNGSNTGTASSIPVLEQ